MDSFLPLEANFDGIIVLLVLIMVGPALLLFGGGFAIRKKSKQASKVLYILAGVYLLVSLGICGGLMGGF